MVGISPTTLIMNDSEEMHTIRFFSGVFEFNDGASLRALSVCSALFLKPFSLVIE